MNQSQATFGQKIYNTPIEDKKRIKSRWETAQYGQQQSYNTGELGSNPPVDLENSLSPKTGRLRQNMVNYNSLNTNVYNGQPYPERKNNFMFETVSD